MELKASEFKTEFASKMVFYLTALDEEVKDENDNSFNWINIMSK